MFWFLLIEGKTFTSRKITTHYYDTHFTAVVLEPKPQYLQGVPYAKSLLKRAIAL